MEVVSDLVLHSYQTMIVFNSFQFIWCLVNDFHVRNVPNVSVFNALTKVVIDINISLTDLFFIMNSDSITID